MTLDAAMALYDLQCFELLWEKALDTKVLLAWNATTCVLCFRGTSSWANVLADLEARACTASNPLSCCWSPCLMC